MTKTKIEWTETTWNPITGCSKISPGCANCYAEKMAKRLKAMGQPNYQQGFEVVEQPQMLIRPSEWKKPRKIFVNSMSDLFHYNVSTNYIKIIFDTMNVEDRHIYQILTKRSERLLELSPILNWSQNIWAGVSVENQDYLFRVEHLRKTNAQIKFLSLEPLLGPLSNLNLDAIDWVIVGGESGPNSRPMNSMWVRDIRDKCIKADVPFFFKQWGGVNKRKSGKILDGKIWAEVPSKK